MNAKTGAQINPRISVVVPVFNEPVAVLQASLSSVRDQGFTDFECLIIDESTNETTALACRAFCESDPRFRYVRPSDRIGLAASLNLGIAQAQGDLIARFDSDDLCLHDRLEQQVAYLDANPQIGVVGGALEIISETGEHLATRYYPVEHALIERHFQTTSAIAHPTAMIRKSLLQRHGAYDPQFRFAEDLDLWLRLLNRGVRFANIPAVLVQYRQQNTRRKTDHWRFNLKARLRNFSGRQLPRRVLGIVVIGAWRFVPPRVQETLFAQLLLRRTH